MKTAAQKERQMILPDRQKVKEGIAKLDAEIAAYETELAELNGKIEELDIKIDEYEAEITLLEARIAEYENEEKAQELRSATLENERAARRSLPKSIFDMDIVKEADGCISDEEKCEELATQIAARDELITLKDALIDALAEKLATVNTIAYLRDKKRETGDARIAGMALFCRARNSTSAAGNKKKI